MCIRETCGDLILGSCSTFCEVKAFRVCSLDHKREVCLFVSQKEKQLVKKNWWKKKSCYYFVVLYCCDHYVERVNTVCGRFFGLSVCMSRDYSFCSITLRSTLSRFKSCLLHIIIIIIIIITIIVWLLSNLGTWDACWMLRQAVAGCHGNKTWIATMRRCIVCGGSNTCLANKVSLGCIYLHCNIGSDD